MKSRSTGRNVRSETSRNCELGRRQFHTTDDCKRAKHRNKTHPASDTRRVLEFFLLRNHESEELGLKPFSSHEKDILLMRNLCHIDIENATKNGKSVEACFGRLVREPLTKPPKPQVRPRRRVCFAATACHLSLCRLFFLLGRLLFRKKQPGRRRNEASSGKVGCWENLNVS